MKYRLLGKSGIEVSELGFGCMSLKGDQITNHRIIHSAVDEGINFFDTADLYDHGSNEETVGKALKSFRKEIILATKAGNQWKEDGSGWDWNPGKDYILKCAKESLKRLQTDYIDLYQLHGGKIDDPIDETIEAFEILKSQGLIREYGISSIRPNVIREWIERSEMTSVMMQYSLLDRRPEEECLDTLGKNNVGVIARGVLAKGLLAGKPASSFLNYSEDEVISLIKAMDGNPASRTSIAIKYVLSNSNLSTLAIGMRTSDQLSEILKAYHEQQQFKEFPLSVLKVIAPNKYELHR
ncbi:MAG: aldo/keto reductase [Bacteroidetes bacterium]|nr:aldo/keto reductase [Bacteroidota bacterium]MDA1120577.1 aldo/keto reductase [Bacteroidota bacterium]